MEIKGAVLHQSLWKGLTMAQYADLEYADNYFENRLHSGLWANSLAQDRNSALTMATQRIDRLSFTGQKAAAFVITSAGGTDANANAAGLGQGLEFPRGSDSSVPNDIKIACCEIAYSLLDGRDPDAEIEDLSVTSRGFSSVRSANTRDFVHEHLACGIPSSLAWSYLRPYLLDRRTLEISRVN